MLYAITVFHDLIPRPPMSTINPDTTALTATDWHPLYRRSEELGEEITELCGYIYAATYRLLEMIREFDSEGLWQVDGIGSCAHWLKRAPWS